MKNRLEFSLVVHIYFGEKLIEAFILKLYHFSEISFNLLMKNQLRTNESNQSVNATQTNITDWSLEFFLVIIAVSWA